MSKISVGTVQCNSCKRELKVNKYNSINETLDYKLREKLLNNELTDITCECGQILNLRYPILYHKMGILNSVMIQYTQSDIEEVKKQHEKAKQFMDTVSLTSLFRHPLLSDLGGALKKQIECRDDVYEVYNDWDMFIKRIKEIE